MFKSHIFIFIQVGEEDLAHAKNDGHEESLQAFRRHLNRSWGGVPAALALSLAPLLQKRVLLRGLLGIIPYIYMYIYIHVCIYI